MRLYPGEVFAIETKIGYGFFQYIKSGERDIETVRVLEPIRQLKNIEQFEVDLKERYVIDFVLKTALSRKLVERVSIFEIPKNFSFPKKSRTEHFIGEEFIGWHIIDRRTLKRELKQKLTANDLLLSPHGIPNDTLLKEWLECDFRLENWR